MRKEIENWLEQAKSDLAAAKNSLKSRNFDWACFQSQQAAEKALKAKYIKLYQNLLKIHDLTKLAKEIYAPEEIIQKCSKISPVYFEVRYPEGDEFPSQRITKMEAEEIITLAEEVLQWIQSNL